MFRTLSLGRPNRVVELTPVEVLWRRSGRRREPAVLSRFLPGCSTWRGTDCGRSASSRTGSCSMTFASIAPVPCARCSLVSLGWRGCQAGG